jgi:low affinity Fe/Cu permease
VQKIAASEGVTAETNRDPTESVLPRREGVGEHLAQTVSRSTGSTAAFSVAVVGVAIWALTGPIFHWSDTWQLVMNTASSIVTFLMVFLIQRSQNKDALAIHVKLNEIVAAIGGANNRIVNVEGLSEEELRRLHERYQEVAGSLEEAGDSRGPLHVSHPHRRDGENVSEIPESTDKSDAGNGR